MTGDQFVQRVAREVTAAQTDLALILAAASNAAAGLDGNQHKGIVANVRSALVRVEIAFDAFDATDNRDRKALSRR